MYNIFFEIVCSPEKGRLIAVSAGEQLLLRRRRRMRSVAAVGTTGRSGEVPLRDDRRVHGKGHLRHFEVTQVSTEEPQEG